MGNILFNKTRKVKSPSRAYGATGDAGIDFYVPSYCPEFWTDLISKNPNKDYYECSITPNRDSMTITIAPHGRILIPSGIRVIMNNPGTCLLAVNKSGIAHNKGLVCGSCLVDESYIGEIHISLINTTDEPVSVKTDDKVIQFVHLPVYYTFFQEILTEDFYKLSDGSARGANGFGSSG